MSSERRRITTFEEWQELAKKAPRRWIIYGTEDKPPSNIMAVLLGIQQYLIMFGATVSIPLLLGNLIAQNYQIPEDIARIMTAELISIIFFVSGVTTLLQTWPKTGSGLPIIQGGSFSFLGPTIAIITSSALIAKLEGYASLEEFIAATSPEQRFAIVCTYINGAILAAAPFEIILGYSGIAGKLKRVITPVSIGPTVALIGLALYPAGAPMAAPCAWEGFLVVLLIIILNQIIGRKVVTIQMFSVLLSILIVWAIAAILTVGGVLPPDSPCRINLAPIEDMIRRAYYVRPPIPMPWGPPKFYGPFALGMLAAYLASMVESIGDYHSVARMAEAPPPTEKMISKGLGAEGLGCAIGALFGNINGSTSYSENIGAIGLTRVASRWVFQLGGLSILILGGILYVWGAFMATMPSPLVGGMYIAVFGLIAAVGLSLLSLCDMKSARNLFIVGLALFAGLSIPVAVDQYRSAIMAAFPPPWEWVGHIVVVIGSTGMAVGAIIGILLDNILPATPEERGLTHPEWVG